MPKMKTHKGIKKRVRLTAKGKVRHKRANAGHLMSGKSSKRKRAIRKSTFVSAADRGLARKMLNR